MAIDRAITDAARLATPRADHAPMRTSIEISDVGAQTAERHLARAARVITRVLGDAVPSADVRVTELRLVEWRDLVGFHACVSEGSLDIDGISVAVRVTGFSPSLRRQTVVTIAASLDHAGHGAFVRIPVGRTRLVADDRRVEPLVFLGLVHESACLSVRSVPLSLTWQLAARRLAEVRASGAIVPPLDQRQRGMSGTDAGG